MSSIVLSRYLSAKDGENSIIGRVCGAVRDAGGGVCSLDIYKSKGVLNQDSWYLNKTEKQWNLCPTCRWGGQGGTGEPPALERWPRQGWPSPDFLFFSFLLKISFLYFFMLLFKSEILLTSTLASFFSSLFAVARIALIAFAVTWKYLYIRAPGNIFLGFLANLICMISLFWFLDCSSHF